VQRALWHRNPCAAKDAAPSAERGRGGPSNSSSTTQKERREISGREPLQFFSPLGGLGTLPFRVALKGKPMPTAVDEGEGGREGVPHGTYHGRKTSSMQQEPALLRKKAKMPLHLRKSHLRRGGFLPEKKELRRLPPLLPRGGRSPRFQKVDIMGEKKKEPG